MLSFKETELLIKANITATPIRILVLSTFLKYKEAFSLKNMEDALFFTEKSTIFRTLQLFESKGIVHTIIASDGIKSYALCSISCIREAHKHSHAHLKCKRCLKIYCIPVNSKNLHLKDYKFDDIQIFINGICKVCNSIALP
ncbi:transcriptional repressor [Maribacter sp.]|uniref:Fur family transcriptional regulator n=1 Tax=Maribacter sp. TaxID=1897614 RepID=UPI0025BB2C57|nr:transcriptional repressor [Maribacter sp.]